MPPEQDETAGRRTNSAPPPDFDDDPVHGVTKQTPKEELQRWRQMAAAGGPRARSDESTRSVENPLALAEPPTTTLPRPVHNESPTRELELPSDVIALGRPEPTQAALPRPAIPPVKHSFPPENVPPAPPIGVSIPPGLLSQSLPAPARPAPARSRWPLAIAALVLLGAVAGGATLVLMPPPEDLGWGPSPPAIAPAPATIPPASVGSTPAPSSAVVPVATPASTGSSVGTPPVGAPPSVAPPPSVVPVVPTPVVPPPSVAPVVPTPVAPTPPSVAPTPAPPSVAPPSVAPASDVSATPAPGVTADSLVAAGDEAAAAGEHARALELYQQAIGLDAHDPYAFAGAARACLALGRNDEAVRFAERAVANRRRRAVFRVLLGDALAAAGDRARAEREWQEALALDPDDATARDRLGR